jgi:hypothetical protein
MTAVTNANDLESHSFPSTMTGIVRSVPTVSADKIYSGSVQFSSILPCVVFLSAASIMRDTRSEKDSPNRP